MRMMLRSALALSRRRRLCGRSQQQQQQQEEYQRWAHVIVQRVGASGYKHHRQHQHQQQRTASTQQQQHQPPPPPPPKQRLLLQYAVQTVQQHDTAAYLPGRLLPDATMRAAYFGIRAFWIEMGLRFGSTAAVPPNSTPAEHLQWWQEGIDHVFATTTTTSTTSASPSSDKKSLLRLPPIFDNHPILQLLHQLKQQDQIPWTKQHFDDVLDGRRKDLDIQQYETLQDLLRHAEQSCGSLTQLVLEGGNITEATNPIAHEAAKLIGICHGLSNQLRHSIPVLSTTGKLIIPAELTRKYGVRSPRYLMSALSLGDNETCLRAFQSAVRDIVEAALEHLQQARNLRDAVVHHEPRGTVAATCLLSSIPAELFLRRLQQHDLQLTDRNLRHVGVLEHSKCAAKIMAAYYQSKY